jgi:cystathionine gamma-synthase/cystathionine gamma-lyase/cystathionine beta-lyase
VALPEVARFANAHGLVSLIDNTIATPINFRPAEHGFDVVLHSATKYLNGHADIVAGVACGNAARVGAIKRVMDHVGGALDPHACFLLHRGLKTLALRMRHHNDSAAALAAFLASHPKVTRVHYAGRHARASLLAGGSGIVGFETANPERFLERMTIPVYAPSLGGPESLATRPAKTSHQSLGAEARARQGITDELIRVSVGLESTEDLIEDFARALEG